MNLQNRVGRVVLSALLALLLWAPRATATEKTEDLTPRLQQIYDLRARWILSDDAPPEIEHHYLPRSKTAKWALNHELGKFKYMKQWAENRGVRIVHSKPTIKVKQLKVTPERARFYVEQSHALGYVYPGEEQVNLFGVGTRHIIELRKHEESWLISTEWYTDPLGDDTEVPDVSPAMLPSPPTPSGSENRPALAGEVAAAGYDREGAVRYADQYCGVAWGCGNEHRYNPKFRDYNGVGGDCTNFVSQALRVGGGLPVPTFTRVDGLSGHIQYSGRGHLAAKGSFQNLMKVAREKGGFPNWIKKGDVVAYQEKGEMAHFAIVTAFDSHGYPLVNSHTADRYHVPFDLGWDRKTTYWLYRLNG